MSKIVTIFNGRLSQVRLEEGSKYFEEKFFEMIEHSDINCKINEVNDFDEIFVIYKLNDVLLSIPESICYFIAYSLKEYTKESVQLLRDISEVCPKSLFARKEEVLVFLDEMRGDNYPYLCRSAAAPIAGTIGQKSFVMELCEDSCPQVRLEALKSLVNHFPEESELLNKFLSNEKAGHVKEYVLNRIRNKKWESRGLSVSKTKREVNNEVTELMAKLREHIKEEILSMIDSGSSVKDAVDFQKRILF